MSEDKSSKDVVLLPCPHCGRQQSVEFNNHSDELEELDVFGWWRVICSGNASGCGSSSGYWETQEEAAQHWNARMPSVETNGESVWGLESRIPGDPWRPYYAMYPTLTKAEAVNGRPLGTEWRTVEYRRVIRAEEPAGARDWVIVCGNSWYGKNGKFVANEWDARGFPSANEAMEFAKGMRCPWSVRERVQVKAAADYPPTQGAVILDNGDYKS